MSVIMPSKQGFKENPDGSFSITEKRVEYGKITGTQISGLLGVNPWQTPFSTCVRMMRLFSEDISDKPAVHAGSVIESKILDYLGAVHGDDIFQKREGDHEAWVSDFEDEIFGGHIDGLMPDGSIVEIKTSSRPKDWVGGVPVYYHMQASLYAHFFKTNNIVFGVGFTDAKTLADPDSFVPNEDNTVRINVTVMDGFEDMMAEAEKIYRNTVLKGVTPVPDMLNPIDAEICEYLKAQLWNEDEARKEADRAGSIAKDLDAMKKMQTDLEKSKQRLSLYLDFNNSVEIVGDSATARKSTFTRTSVDTNQLRKDGLYDLYVKEKEYNVLKINRK